jgi:hypothetical protein
LAGTIIVDRIESDASYTSTINVAGQITFSNTVNFGAFAGTAPVAGFYLPTTNNLAFTTASTERMRLDSSGNLLVGSSSAIGTGGKFQVTSSTDTSIFKCTSATTYAAIVSNVENIGARLIAFQYGSGGSPTTVGRITTDGTNIALATVSGITFPATQSASADANTLDDYEEGTYTPTSDAAVNATSVTFTTGRYVKIGRLVTVWVIGTASVTSSGVKVYFTLTAPFPQASTNLQSSGNAFFETTSGVYATGSIVDASSGDSRALAAWAASAITFTGSATFACGFTYEAA